MGQEHLSVERVLSGPSLGDVYRVLAELQGKPVSPLQAPDVVKRTLAGEDPIARETIERFAIWLGRFAALLSAGTGLCKAEDMRRLYPQVHLQRL
jgi:glucokinase